MGANGMKFSRASCMLLALSVAGCGGLVEREASREDDTAHVSVVREIAARVTRPVHPIALVAPLVQWPSPLADTDETTLDQADADDKGWPRRRWRSRQPPRVITADPCARANAGDGYYCGQSLGASASSGLYLCRGGQTARVMPCTHGCLARPPGTPDECALAPGSRTEFYMPLACGQRVDVLQGHHGTFSHDGMNTWAYDFTIPRGTPVYAMESGRVTHVRDEERPGSACWNGGGRGCIEHSNYVSILHADGTRTLYLHLDAPEVARGQTVTRGQRIGRSGNTGWSTRPHLHVQRQANCARWFCQSQPLSLQDAGMLSTGERATSRNCP